MVALLAWFAAEDARQAALLDARVGEARERAEQALDLMNQLEQNRAPAAEVRRADEEYREALTEIKSLSVERARRQQSWPARLLREARRRTGW
jgi:hypothetical protein